MRSVSEFFSWMYAALFGRWANLAGPHNIDFAEQAMEISVFEEGEVQVEQVEVRQAA